MPEKTKVPSKKQLAEARAKLDEIEKKLAEAAKQLEHQHELTAKQRMEESDAAAYELALRLTLARNIRLLYS